MKKCFCLITGQNSGLKRSRWMYRPSIVSLLGLTFGGQYIYLLFFQHVNKQYITVDNRYALLYTVYCKGGLFRYAYYTKPFLHGAHL